MTQSDLKALLGRPLTPKEIANFDLYLDIATESLESLLCISLDVQGESPTAAERTFNIRVGYETVFTGIFTQVNEVKVDGKAETGYYAAFWDDRNNAFYNSIVLDVCKGKEVAITALWGFAELPSDLKRLLAQLFAATSKKYSTGSVKSKRVEDFQITYADVTDDQAFMDANRRAIQKYGMCNIGYIRHGKVCKHGRHCFRCL